MIKDDFKIDEENDLGGEIEIERIPTRMIEARSKDLVPVLGYLRAPKFQQGRCVELLIFYFFLNLIPRVEVQG